MSRAWIIILCLLSAPLFGASPQYSDSQQDYVSKPLPSDQRLDEDVWRKKIANRDYSEGALPESPDYDFDTPNVDGLAWLKYPLIALFIALLVYLIVKFIPQSNLKLNKKVVTDITKLDGQPDDLEAWDLPTMLEQALSQSDYRLAVRIRFLMLLKNLQDKGWLRYAKDKTNMTYVRELYPRDEAQPFSQLTRDYEYAWYGGLGVSQADYKRFELQSTQIDTPQDEQS